MANVRIRKLIPALLAGVALGGPLAAQDRALSYSLYGMPGLIEMPTAMMAPDAEYSVTFSAFDYVQRATLTFQISPRLSGSFRYSAFDTLTRSTDTDEPGIYRNFDRSFDLRYQIADEGEWMPAIAVGLQDFLGTSFFGGEYVVATKTFSNSLRVSAGIGWGRLGSQGGFTNPLGIIDSRFETRPGREFVLGGQVSHDAFFRGDAAFFGGVEYLVRDDLTFTIEYSSDAYEFEEFHGIYEVDSPLNFGLTWRTGRNHQISLAYLYGNQIAISGTAMLNPNERPSEGGLDTPPMPVLVRGADVQAAQSWDRVQNPEAAIRARLQNALAAEGIALDYVQLDDRSVRLRYTNTRYRAEAQAMGRVVRALTRELPPSVEVLVLEPMQSGLPLSSMTIQRRDAEALENVAGGTDAMWQRAQLDDAAPRHGLVLQENRGDPFSWSLSPYGKLILFDGDNATAIDVGLRLRAAYELQPNLVVSGALTYQLYTTAADKEIETHPTIPVVRRNAAIYSAEGSPAIERLTLDHYGRPGRDLYSRVTIGYMEQMFGGVSAELLWKPVDSRIALGAEVNYAIQRDFDGLLGFQDYDVVTGHASIYYDIPGDYHAQLDVGRYLAGDWGATLALDREFANGWRFGAYVTLTDMDAEDFGEGSFDKGLRVTIPIDYVLGTPSRYQRDVDLRSLNRDGGARLNVEGRLYDIVRDGHESDLGATWGRFWR